MPIIECQQCGRIGQYGIFDPPPECGNCGSTEFKPVSDTSDNA